MLDNRTLILFTGLKCLGRDNCFTGRTFLLDLNSNAFSEMPAMREVNAGSACGVVNKKR